MYVKRNTKVEKSYEIETIIDKKIKKFEKPFVTQYKVKWLKYDSKFNKWRAISKLNHCMNLIKEYETNQIETDA